MAQNRIKHPSPPATPAGRRFPKPPRSLKMLSRRATTVPRSARRCRSQHPTRGSTLCAAADVFCASAPENRRDRRRSGRAGLNWAWKRVLALRPSIFSFYVNSADLELKQAVWGGFDDNEPKSALVGLCAIWGILRIILLFWDTFWCSEHIYSFTLYHWFGCIYRFWWC